MAVLSLGKKHFILPSFRSITRTSVFEGERDQLRKEFDEFSAFENSKELAGFIELEKSIKSDEFLHFKKNVITKRQDDKAKESQFAGMKKQKSFIRFFKTKSSPKTAEMLAYAKSQEYSRYETLLKKVNSPDFASQKKAAETALNELLSKEKQLTELRKSASVSKFLKTRDSGELKWFLTYHESDELKHYMELENYINSEEFTRQNGKKENGNKSPEEDKKWLDYKEMRSHSNIKRYFSFLNSEEYNHYKHFISSKEYKDFTGLEKAMESEEFKNRKNESERTLSEIKKQEDEFKTLTASSSVKHYLHFINSSGWKEFLSFEGSKEYATYLDLEKYLGSEERKSLLAEIEKQESDISTKEKQYNDFSGSKQYKNYLVLKTSNKFDELKRWEITFEDHFEGNTLNREKWMTRYFYGDKLINESYSLAGDLHHFTDGKNLEFGNSILKIMTRHENHKGKAWTPPYGFLEKDFSFTSGMISTAKSFRQKYGRFEAKIKTPGTKGVRFAFWMVADQILPQIDIARNGDSSGTIVSGLHSGKADNPGAATFHHGSFKGINTTDDFYIYSMDWNESKITWKINDVVIYEQTSNIPSVEMYVVLSAGVSEGVIESGLPAGTYIDWVRCYQKYR